MATIFPLPQLASIFWRHIITEINQEVSARVPLSLGPAHAPEVNLSWILFEYLSEGSEKNVAYER